MSTAMMSAPSAAMRTACARPWPRAAPVMNATLPVSRPLMCAPRASRRNFSTGRPHESTPDDQALDFARALIQAQQANIAVYAFHGHPLHVSAAPVDLHCEIGDLARHLGAEQLGRRRCNPSVLVGQPQARGITDQGASGHH